jgi:hypothetical protein
MRPLLASTADTVDQSRVLIRRVADQFSVPDSVTAVRPQTGQLHGRDEGTGVKELSRHDNRGLTNLGEPLVAHPHAPGHHHGPEPVAGGPQHGLGNAECSIDWNVELSSAALSSLTPLTRPIRCMNRYRRAHRNRTHDWQSEASGCSVTTGACTRRRG